MTSLQRVRLPNRPRRRGPPFPVLVHCIGTAGSFGDVLEDLKKARWIENLEKSRTE
jgi:hypothetical protein